MFALLRRIDEDPDTAIARRHRANRVVAVGVECDEHEPVCRAAIADLLVVVLDHECAALRRRRQQDHECADHAVGLLGVLVSREELTRSVHEQVVELGAQRAALRQAEIACDALERWIERAPPAPRVDLHLALADLPGVAHAPVEQRLVSQAIPGGMRDLAQAARARLGQRQRDRSGADHVEVELIDARGPPRRERPRRPGAREHLSDPIDRARVRCHERSRSLHGAPARIVESSGRTPWRSAGSSRSIHSNTRAASSRRSSRHRHEP